MVSASLDRHSTWTCDAKSRQKHRRLSRGVAAADDDHLLALAELRFHRRGQVVDARALEAGAILDLELLGTPPRSR